MKPPSQEETFKVRIHTGDGKETLGEVKLKTWAQVDRYRRAFKTLGMIWAAALCAVLLPVVHFILVPSLLIAGPIGFFAVFNQKSVVLGGSGICPKCGKEIKIEKARDVWPIDDVCGHCQFPVKIAKI